MHPNKGVIMIALGDKARNEQRLAEQSLRQFCDLPAWSIFRNDTDLDGKAASRSIKTRMLSITTFRDVLYLDADTRVLGDLSAGFEMLEAGWDMAVSFSDHQEADAFWHVGEQERQLTALEFGCIPLQFQCGVMFVRKNERTEAFFAAWYDEWRRYGGEDQAAFVRALKRVPLKVWLLGRPWNGGSLIAHHWGACR